MPIVILMRRTNITITVPDKQIEGVKYMLFEYFGLQVSADFIEQLLKEHLSLIHEVIDDTYTDTYVRDCFANYISQKLIGRNWPISGDTDRYKKRFWKEFGKAAKKYNIGIVI